MFFVIGLLLLLIAGGSWEFRRHQKNINGIRLRILVNGTRGKSSVTRLITAALRGGKIRTLGKTTGTAPRLILPEGSELPIHRPGKPNIIEQRMVFRRAAELSVEALVTECMAVLPPNQVIMQEQLVRSLIGVITNIRADHLDEMGPTMDDVAICLAQTIPANGSLFTCEQQYFHILNDAAKKKNCTITQVPSDHITDEMMRGFTYIEHKDNVALALAVSSHLGVPVPDALAEMHRANPDPGVLRIYTIHHYEKEIGFVNAFAANDPDSYTIIWSLLKSYFTPEKKKIVLVNCRKDRIQRTESLADLIASKLPADYFILAGESTIPLYNRSLALGLPSNKIFNMGEQTTQDIFEKVVLLAGQAGIVIGVGNIVGFGEEITNYFTTKGKELVY